MTLRRALFVSSFAIWGAFVLATKATLDQNVYEVWLLSIALAGIGR